MRYIIYGLRSKLNHESIFSLPLLKKSTHTVTVTQKNKSKFALLDTLGIFLGCVGTSETSQHAKISKDLEKGGKDNVYQCLLKLNCN